MGESRVNESGQEFKNFCQLYDDELCGLNYDELIFDDFIDRLNNAKEIIISNGGRKYKELSKLFSSAKEALSDSEYNNEAKRYVARENIISAINIIREKKLPYEDIWKGLRELENLEYDLDRRYQEAR